MLIMQGSWREHKISGKGEAKVRKAVQKDQTSSQPARASNSPYHDRFEHHFVIFVSNITDIYSRNKN